MPAPPPIGLIEIAVEPASETDRQRLDVVLAALRAKDPLLMVSTDAESGQTLLHGQSEQELESLLALIEAHGVALKVGAPQVAYHETITRRTEVDYSHKKVWDGGGEFARVELAFEPGPSNSGFVFQNSASEGVVPAQYVPHVRNGVERAKDDGLLAGFPLTDFKAVLVGGAYHGLESTPAAFEAAARRGFQALREKGGPILLEPIMALQITTPEAYLKQVLDDLNGRRGHALDRSIRGDAVVVEATAPLASLFGYGHYLRGMTEGRAAFAMQYERYDPVPRKPEDDPTFTPAMGMRA